MHLLLYISTKICYLGKLNLVALPTTLSRHVDALLTRVVSGYKGMPCIANFI